MWLILLLFTLCGAREHVPVLLWGSYGNTSPTMHAPALSKLRSFQFSELLHELIAHKPHILLFKEENLSVEDFSWKDSNDLSSFPHLRNMSQSSSDFIYLPSVESPLLVFEQLKNHGYSVITYHKDFPTARSQSLIEVTLREPTQAETRPMFLKSHDEEMKRLSKEFMLKYKSGLIAYTAKHASFVESLVSRPKRQVVPEEEEEKDLIFFDNEKTVFIVTKSPMVLQQGNVVTNITWSSTYASKSITGDQIQLDVNFKRDEIMLSLDFIFDSPLGQAWTLTELVVEGKNVKLKSKQPIGAPAEYSYFCARDIVFEGYDANSTLNSIVFHGLQAQPRMVQVAFGPAADCIPYFSAQILSGLFVSSLLIVVLFISVIFILDIQTMDKFDDPKGRMITVSNAE